MAEVMFDQDGTRIVLLNRSFGKDGRDQQELRVRLTKDGAMFFHLAQDAAPKNYGLSAAEADAFVESWLAHRTEQKDTEQTEQERLQAMVTEAFKIAAEQPAIQIRQLEVAGKPAWKVSVPAIAWGHQGPVSSAQELLELTKQAWYAYQSHQRLSTSKATA